MYPKKLKFSVLLFLTFTLAFFVRIFFVNRWVFGDVLVFAEWGEKFWKYGPASFYFAQDWYYSFPTQPPISSLLYAAAYWLFDHKYVLAQIHNSTKLIPSAFINYFYDMEQPVFWAKNGYILLLKLPAILADLGIAVVIYKVLLTLVKSRNKAFLGACVYLFNPVTVFLSGVWGQPESLVAFLGLLSFILLVWGKPYLSLPLFFLSLYTKPTWAIFIPIYIFVLFTKRQKLYGIFTGFVLTSLIFLAVTVPFSGRDIIGFTKKAVIENMLPSAKGTAKVSVSAFNLYAVLFQIDKDLESAPILAIPANILGIVVFAFIYIFTLSYLKREKDRLFPVIVGIFTIGLGAFLFLTNMLERYFFASFAPMIVILFSRPKTFLPILLINTVLFLNIIYGYFRRSWDPMTRMFTANSFLLIRFFSAVLVVGWVSVGNNLNILKFSALIKSLKNRF